MSQDSGTTGKVQFPSRPQGGAMALNTAAPGVWEETILWKAES